MDNKILQIVNHEHRVITLVKKFVRDYSDLSASYTPAQQLELTEHLIFMLEQLGHYIVDEDYAYCIAYLKAEDELLKKYGSQFKPYLDKEFSSYFIMKDTVLIQDYTKQDRDWGERNNFTPEEINGFIYRCQVALAYFRQNLYLNDAGKTSDLALADNVMEHRPNESQIAIKDKPDKDATKARQLLTIYYFLKSTLDIEGRISNSISSIVKLIHLLTGTKFTNIQNSGIYKKYALMPNYKKDAALLADLKYIRPIFEGLGIENALTLIDEEIKTAIKELSVNDRKKQNKKDI
jgi:hypothetical protein